MANKHRGEVSIKLDKIRKLKFTTNALAELEEALGHSMSKMDPDNMGINTIRKMFWAGLLHAEPDLTLKEAGDLMDYTSLSNVAEKVNEAFELAFGNEEEENSKNKMSGQNSAGKKSKS